MYWRAHITVLTCGKSNYLLLLYYTTFSFFIKLFCCKGYQLTALGFLGVIKKNTSWQQLTINIYNDF